MSSADIGRRVGAVLAISVLLSGCAARMGPSDDSPSRIWDVRAQAFIEQAVFVARLKEARYRLLGEVHDNPLHHTLRAGLIKALGARGIHPAVVFEPFDLGNDHALEIAQAAHADAEGIAAAGELNRRAWQWPLHKPVVEAALALHLPIYAGNASRSMLDSLMKRSDVSEMAIAAEERLAHARWTDTQAMQLRQEIKDGHCGKLPDAMIPRLVLAQRLRDAAMAEAVMRDANTDGAVLIAGNGHVRRDLGVSVYLDREAAAKAVSVGLIETDAPIDGVLYPERAMASVASATGFDYVWLTPTIERDDPCMAFQSGRR